MEITLDIVESDTLKSYAMYCSCKLSFNFIRQIRSSSSKGNLWDGPHLPLQSSSGGSLACQHRIDALDS